MRVIAGMARGTKLRAPRGLEVRPTSGRLREALFSALGDRIEGAVVWDACAGTGAIGIESLSRGAAEVVFTERLAASVLALRRNLTATRFEARSVVIAGSWQNALPGLVERGRRFRFVYFDPPYDEGGSARFLAAVAPLLEADAQVAVEHRRRDLQACGGGLEPRRTLVAGDAAVTFFAKP